MRSASGRITDLKAHLHSNGPGIQARVDQTLTHGLQAAKVSAAPRVPPRRPAAEPSTVVCDRGVREDPGVAVGIAEEAVSGLVQRWEHGAQKEGAHSLGGRASGGVPYRRDVRLRSSYSDGPMDTIGDAEVIRPGSDQS